MNWFKKLLPPKIKKERKNGNGVPVGIRKKCDKCEKKEYKRKRELEDEIDKLLAEKNIKKLSEESEK